MNLQTAYNDGCLVWLKLDEQYTERKVAAGDDYGGSWETGLNREVDVLGSGVKFGGVVAEGGEEAALLLGGGLVVDHLVLAFGIRFVGGWGRAGGFDG